MDESEGSFSKTLRDANGKKLDGKIELKGEHWRPNRTLNVAVLGRSMKLNPDNPPLTSAQFGLQMVEGVERVIFVSKPTP